MKLGQMYRTSREDGARSKNLAYILHLKQQLVPFKYSCHCIS